MAIIKAGTYRFNDVISAPSDGFVIELEFTSKITIPKNILNQFVLQGADVSNLSPSLIKCDVLYVDYGYIDDGPIYPSIDYNTYEYEGYAVVNGEIINAEYIIGPTFNLVSPETEGKWSDYLGESIQTITIPNDSEVSAEFYEWFTANAVEQKQISGKWKFNDVLSAPSEALYQEVVFETSPAISETAGGLVDGTMTWNIFEVVLEDGVMGVLYAPNVNSSYPPFYDSRYGWDYWAAGTGNDDFKGFGQTINFGTEPQTVSAEFYNWLTENANPVIEETPVASIQYNGSTIASLFGGQTATLKCAGMTMESDVVVEVAENIGETIEDYDGTIIIS